MKKIILSFYKKFANDSLYKNSIFLMLSTAIMSLLGFFFWIIVARLYSVEHVGLGTTLISTVTLISSLSIFGLGNGLIRFLPSSDSKNKMINTSYTLVTIISLLISVIYLIFLKIFSPKLLFVRESIVFSILFVVFTVFTSLNVISENVFIAFRSSKFVLIKNSVYSIAKLILSLFLVAFGAYGILMSTGIAIGIAVLLSFALLVIRLSYLPIPTIDRSIIKSISKFSFGTFIASLLEGLPIVVLPILITNMIDAESSAFFYMDMMIAAFLYIVPEATSQALFAEGSHNESEIKVHFKKAVKIISIIIIPVIIITFFFGKYILLLFGKTYSDEGFILLRLLAISGIFVSIKTIGAAILNIKKRIKLLSILGFTSSTIIFSLSIIFIKMNLFGVVGVGISWIIGYGVVAIIYLIVIKRIMDHS